MTSGVSSTTAARHFLAGAVQAGLTHVVISPGSRSSPLAVACANLDGLGRSIHLDERIAGFAALGQAKASGRVVGLICTSGTAAANFLPAIAEAGQAGVPLVVITADRPPEHRGWGVGQAFDQLRLYGSQVRAFVEMPVGASGGLDHAVRSGHRAVRDALAHAGPVHVNWPFRLPLEEPDDRTIEPEELAGLVATASAPTEEAVRELGSLLTGNRRAVIVAGPGSVPPGPHGSEDRRVIWEFARSWGVPILADVLSGLRGAPDGVPVVDAPDHLVASGTAPVPNLLLRLGDTPTAKPTRLWWEGLDGVHALIDPRRASHDPSHRATHVFEAAPGGLLSAIGSPPAADTVWADEWMELGLATRRTIDRMLDGWPRTTEAHVARELLRVAPADATVVASSSMPVRDLDSFGSAASTVEVLSNRGINGIDGVVSTAIGVSRARSGRRVIVLIGDVALLHDVGGVLDAARNGHDLTVVVPNNDGGGIFSFLPIRETLDDATYRELFHTPHGTDFGFLTGHPGIAHTALSPTAHADGELGDAITTADTRRGVTLLEVPVDTDDNVSFHREVQAAVARSIRG